MIALMFIAFSSAYKDCVAVGIIKKCMIENVKNYFALNAQITWHSSLKLAAR